MKILVAIIAYNESGNIGNTIQSLQKNDLGFDIVLIDNGSSDHTVRIADELGIDTVSHCINSGSSMGTVMTYFLYAYKHGYDIVCQFDGDGQHIASELPKILGPILDGEADYVIGSRFLTGEGFQSSFLRRSVIKIFSWISSIVVGQKIYDVTSGFRAYNKKVIQFFAEKYRHELYDTSQLLLLSHFAGAKIKEVPAEMQQRMYGKSEFSSFTALAYPLKGIISIFGVLMQRNYIRMV